MTPELMTNIWLSAFGIIYGTILLGCVYWKVYLPLKSWAIQLLDIRSNN